MINDQIRRTGEAVVLFVVLSAEFESLAGVAQYLTKKRKIQHYFMEA